MQEGTWPLLGAGTIAPRPVDHEERRDPFTRIRDVDSRGRRERARATGVLAALAHLVFSLCPAMPVASDPRDARAEVPPILVSVEESFEGSAGSGGARGAPTPGGRAGSDARSAPPPAAGGSRVGKRVLNVGASAATASPNVLEDPLAKWILGLPDDAWRGANAEERTNAEGASARGAGTGGGSNGGAGTKGSGGQGGGTGGGAEGSGQGGGQVATFSPDWDCDFPARAKVDGLVRMVVTVTPDGAAASVEILSDTGRAFAEVARECATRQRYIPARDARGRAAPGKTRPFNVRFIH